MTPAADRMRRAALKEIAERMAGLDAADGLSPKRGKSDQHARKNPTGACPCADGKEQCVDDGRD